VAVIWQLWMHYFALGNVVVFENERASQVNQQGEEVGLRGQTGR
jgi:hypothetical protein